MPTRSPQSAAVLIVAAGRGTRAGGGVPKQYQRLGDQLILSRTLSQFLDHPRIGAVAVVIHPADEALYRQAAGEHPKLRPVVHGGAERQDSVRNGLEALAPLAPDLVLIHDAVRPFVSPPLIDRVIEALAADPAVLPAVPVTDTLKRADAAGFVVETVPREPLRAAQTPQGFRFADILAAHRRAQHAAAPYTDDTAVAEAVGIAVRLVTGEPENIKLTTALDIAAAQRRLAAEASLASETRVGTGYDVHAFGPGDGIMLGGIRIPHDRALIGHSDADVALHALTDAILGVIAEGDIGTHFPPSDPAWRGASSDRFLADACRRLRARGGEPVHLDLTIAGEAPRVGPYRDAMRSRIAGIVGVAADRVSVKATTNEGLGFVGRREGLAALATVTVRLPRT